jgi:serine/threonine protein kinase
MPAAQTGGSNVIDESKDELIGTQLGGCQVLDLLGQGGMARVYRGRQEHLDRDVAIKVLPPYYVSDPTFIDRFQREARAMAKLQHPNIVVIYDAGRQAPWLYIVMELIPGGNLRQRMTTSMSMAEATHIFRDIAEALTYAHERGIIHRDVKPVNVLLDTSRPQPYPRAVLSDFGIAKVLQSSSNLTRTGAGVGTPEYMSPEQCKGQSVDTRTDIYALGVLLYEMLCGRPPFVAEEFTAVAHSHIYDPVPAPSLYNPRVTPPVQAVILRALQKRPEQRFQTAREMAQALEDATKQNPPQLPPRPVVATCNQCGASNPVGMNFCQRCGANLRGGPPAPLPSMLSIELPAVTCLNCGATNSGMNRYCTRCGTRLTAIVCPNCGRANAQGARYCATCHNPLTPQR